MTRSLLLLCLLPGCGLVRAVDQAARDAAQDAALAETNVGVVAAQQGVTTNTAAILDLRDRIAETPEERAEIARLRGENDRRIAEIGTKLKNAEAVAAEKARQAQQAEAAIQEADENAWWRIALEIAFAALGVGGVGGLAFRWRNIARGAITALVKNGVDAKAMVPNPDKLVEAFFKNNTVMPVIQALVQREREKRGGG